MSTEYDHNCDHEWIGSKDCRHSHCSKCDSCASLNSCAKPDNKAYVNRKKTEKTGSLEIDCDKCGNRITRPGALLFSPPVDSGCRKYHLCTECYDRYIIPIL